jgi:G3E family GTPase
MAGSTGSLQVSFRADATFPAVGQAPVKTWLVSGFLGAGKTTFILERLKNPAGRVAVLVNEFGELGIDGALIRTRGGIDVVELPGGCVCCSQQEGLDRSIRRIVSELQPELLLIEPSGIAETSELLKLLTAPSLGEVIRLDAAVTVLDAETFLEYSQPDTFGTFFLDQVVHADLILLNKADLVESELLGQVERRIADINPAALLQRTSFCRMEGEPAAGGGRFLAPGRGASLPGMECLSVVPGELSHEEWELFLTELSSGAFGRVVRAKGFLPVRGTGYRNLQIVASRVMLETFTGEAGARLTLIGYGLDGERLNDFFRQQMKE